MKQQPTSTLDLTRLENEMVAISGGRIELRDDRLKRKWMVDLEPFSLCRFPVTQDLYYQVKKESPSSF